METHANPEDFDLYALGLLEGEDREQFEAHLRVCVACQQRLAGAQELCALLGMTEPAVAPPPSVKANLMESIRKEKAMDEQKSPQIPAKPARKRKHWGLRFSLTFAICTIILIWLCSWKWKQNEANVQKVSNMTAQLSQAQETVQQGQKTLHAMTEVMSAPDTVNVALAHQTGTPPGSAHVFYNARMGVVVYTGAIAPAPTDKSYQLWLVPDSGAPVSAGLVASDQKTGAAVAYVPQGLSAKAFAVTLEPKGGQPQPTGPKVLVGAVGNA